MIGWEAAILLTHSNFYSSVCHTQDLISAESSFTCDFVVNIVYS